MDFTNIFVFVLALVAVGCAALGWIIYGQANEFSAFRAVLIPRLKNCEASCSDSRRKIAELESQSPVTLGAHVAELAEAVERLRKTHQRFAGRVSEELWREAAPDNAPPTIDRDALRREHASAILPAGIRK